MYEPALFSTDKFSDEVLLQFAHEIIRNPHDRNGHAVRACDGNWEKATQLMRYSETPEFTQLLIRCKQNMSEMDKTYTKEQFLVTVQDKMNGFDGELWLKSAQFYAKLKGWVSDQPMLNIQNNVIAMPAAQPVSEWEQNAVNNQRALKDEARIINE